MLNRSIRGSPRDTIYILLIVFTVGIVSVAVYGLTAQSYSVFQELNESESNDLPMDRSTQYMGEILGVFNLVNAGTFLMLGVFFLGATYSALQVRSSKLFIFPSFLFLLTSLYLAGLLSDLYMAIAEVSYITSWFNFFDIQTKTMQNLGPLTGILGTVLFIATYIYHSGLRQEVGL